MVKLLLFIGTSVSLAGDRSSIKSPFLLSNNHNHLDSIPLSLLVPHSQ
jgi:hypothetical protein